jgi:hypothetical protein
VVASESGTFLAQEDSFGFFGQLKWISQRRKYELAATWSECPQSCGAPNHRIKTYRRSTRVTAIEAVHKMLGNFRATFPTFFCGATSFF